MSLVTYWRMPERAETKKAPLLPKEPDSEPPVPAMPQQKVA